MKLTCLLSLAFVLLGSQPGLAQDGLIVNVDNPKFHKLVTAIPTFSLPPKASAEEKQLASSGPAELKRLLEYTGLFAAMSEDAWEGLPMSGTRGSRSSGKSSTTKGLEGIDLLQWKGLGVESLTLGAFEREKDGLSLTLRTADIVRGQPLLAKKYTRVGTRELPAIMRRYADLILQAYTGRSGIFASRIAFVGRRFKGAEKQVFICDFDGSNLVQLTSNRGPHLSVQWSPDGRTLVYTSYEDGNPSVFIHDTTTGKKRKLVHSRGLSSGASFAPNGKVIAYSSSENSNDGDVDLFTITPQGTNKRLMVQGRGLDVDPTFSPDGNYIAYVSGRFGNPHLFRGNLRWDADDKVSVTNELRLTYAGWYNVSPSFAPQMDKMIFAGYDRQTDRWDIFIMNIDGTNMERLTMHIGDNERPSFAPNGQMIVFESNRVGAQNVKGQPQIWVMSRDGSNQRPLNVGLWEARTPVWSVNRAE